MKTLRKYELINADGCLMENVMASSMQAAYRHFSALFSGCYTIVCHEYGEEKNVRFK